MNNLSSYILFILYRIVFLHLLQTSSNHLKKFQVLTEPKGIYYLVMITLVFITYSFQININNFCEIPYLHVRFYFNRISWIAVVLAEVALVAVVLVVVVVAARPAAYPAHFHLKKMKMISIWYSTKEYLATMNQIRRV